MIRASLQAIAELMSLAAFGSMVTVWALILT